LQAFFKKGEKRQKLCLQGLYIPVGTKIRLKIANRNQCYDHYLQM
jgi:hypothetical protein